MAIRMRGTAAFPAIDVEPSAQRSSAEKRRAGARSKRTLGPCALGGGGTTDGGHLANVSLRRGRACGVRAPMAARGARDRARRPASRRQNGGPNRLVGALRLRGRRDKRPKLPRTTMRHEQRCRHENRSDAARRPRLVVARQPLALRPFRWDLTPMYATSTNREPRFRGTRVGMSSNGSSRRFRPLGDGPSPFSRRRADEDGLEVARFPAPVLIRRPRDVFVGAAAALVPAPPPAVRAVYPGSSGSKLNYGAQLRKSPPGYGRARSPPLARRATPPAAGPAPPSSAPWTSRGCVEVALRISCAAHRVHHLRRGRRRGPWPPTAAVAAVIKSYPRRRAL